MFDYPCSRHRQNIIEHGAACKAMVAGALLFALCACIPDDGPAMRPGQDCMACHTATGAATGALPGGERGHHASPAWNVAGTVFDPANASSGFEGAEVQITDATGWSFSLRSNEAGNFYSAESPTFPLHVCISANGTAKCQQSPLANGACNSCHSEAGSQGASLIVP